MQRARPTVFSVGARRSQVVAVALTQTRAVSDRRPSRQR